VRILGTILEGDDGYLCTYVILFTLCVGMSLLESLRAPENSGFISTLRRHFRRSAAILERLRGISE
jgi:hypothetical protein